MSLAALTHLMIGLATLGPMPADTPPALPVPAAQLAQLKTMQDVIAVTVLANGERAPESIVLPQLLNRRQTIDYMLVNYPHSLRDSLGNAMPIAWVHVDRTGNVVEAEMAQSCGVPVLDSLALKALRVAWFKPATVGTDTVGVWLPYPARVPPRSQLTAALADMDDDHSQAPVNTPFTDPPVLANRSKVEAAILRVIYNVDPRAVSLSEQFNRAQRIGGLTKMWIYIDASGTVVNTIVKKTSGNMDLDNSAIQIARMMRFQPARNNGQPVDVWIEVPIQFRAR